MTNKGSLLYDCDDAPEKVYITVANLEGPLDRNPDAHVSFEERVKWFHTEDGLPKYFAKSNIPIDFATPNEARSQ